MAIDIPTVPAQSASAFTTASESTDFDQRWDAWREKGAAEDRAFRRRMTQLVPIVIIVAAVCMYALLGR